MEETNLYNNRKNTKFSDILILEDYESTNIMPESDILTLLVREDNHLRLAKNKDLNKNYLLILQSNIFGIQYNLADNSIYTKEYFDGITKVKEYVFCINKSNEKDYLILVQTSNWSKESIYNNTDKFIFDKKYPFEYVYEATKEDLGDFWRYNIKRKLAQYYQELELYYDTEEVQKFKFKREINYLLNGFSYILNAQKELSLNTNIIIANLYSKSVKELIKDYCWSHLKMTSCEINIDEEIDYFRLALNKLDYETILYYDDKLDKLLLEISNSPII